MGQFKWAYIASNVQPDLLIHGQCVYTLVSYPTLSAVCHFIRHLPGSGKDLAQNCCTESGVNLIRQLITDSLIKNYQVSHNASVKTHRSMQIEDRYEQFRDYPLGTPYRRRTDGGWLYQWFFAQGPCCLIAKWPWNRGYGKPVITTFLPVPSIMCGTNLVLCICPLWSALSLLMQETFHLPEQLQFAISITLMIFM